MAMHGGHGRHGGSSRMGGHRGHRMPSRPRGRMPHPAPMVGFGGMMSIRWIFAPFMGIVVMMMFLGSMINSVTNFSTILGLLCIVGAIYILYQMRLQDKIKRKLKSQADDYYDNAYDDTIS